MKQRNQLMNTMCGEVTGGGFPRLSYTPEELAAATGFSRTRIFEAIRSQELTARKSGKATVIEASEGLRWLRSLPARGRQPKT